MRLLAPLAAVILLGPPLAAAASDNQKYVGETEDGRTVKLVADQRGKVIRGAITAETDCTGSYEPFRARVEFRKPLDRAGPRGFRDKGAYLEEDDRYSARYKYVVTAERESKRVLAGELDLEITFRREGEEYTRCSVEKLVFSAKRSQRGDE